MSLFRRKTRCLRWIDTYTRPVRCQRDKGHEGVCQPFAAGVGSAQGPAAVPEVATTGSPGSADGTQPIAVIDRPGARALA